MNNNYRIKTLTPLHIGSGESAMKNADFLYLSTEGKVAVLDQEKVLSVIGESNIDQWISCVDKGEGLEQLLRQYKPGLQAEDVALRTLPVRHRGLDKKKDVKEQLHDGFGKALLPGSSLKGSIRTALFAHFINEKNGDDVKTSRNLTNNRGSFSDSNLMRMYFGDDPNHDILRLLRPGDATFKQTACTKAETLNLKGKAWVLDSELVQFVEIIAEQQEAGIALHFDRILEKNASSRNYFINDLSVLEERRFFSIINHHTDDLARREMAFWEDDENDRPEAVDTYLEKLAEIRAEIKKCQPHECVLRLGWGTGFRNMTGDWHINMNDNDYYDLVGQVRKTHPDNYLFPKSMRLLADGTPLGYVKL